MKRLLRLMTLGVVLAVCGLVVPDSSVRTTDALLVENGRAAAVDYDRDVVWILAVGSDARPGEVMTRTRADALQLVGINTRTGSATVIGIPRDSWVPIPGRGSSRVNAALTYGGPELLGRTVGNLVGVRPHYVFVTRFQFFENMVDDIGGISVRNPRFFADPSLRKDGFKAGEVRLRGYGAMAFARIRKGLPNGDFGRSANQQRVLRGIHRAIVARADRPGFIENGVMSVLRNMRTDLSPAELFRLAQAVADVKPSQVTGCIVPGRAANVAGASVVLPNVSKARRYGNDARRDATISRC